MPTSGAHQNWTEKEENKNRHPSIPSNLIPAASIHQHRPKSTEKRLQIRKIRPENRRQKWQEKKRDDIIDVKEIQHRYLNETRIDSKRQSTTAPLALQKKE
jgi:hypothetical protein